MLILWALACIASSASASPLKVIVDTDIGRDMDDSWALAFLLGRPDVFDIRLILTSTFDTRGKAQIVAKHVHSAHRTDIDIGIGKPTPYNSSIKNVPGCRVGPMYPWASSYKLSTYPGRIYEDGVAQMAAIIAAIPDVLILELAPLTSILAMRQRFPSLDTGRVKLYAMGGSIRFGYKGRPFLEPEYNIFIDLPAAQVVFNSSRRHPSDNMHWGQVDVAPLDTSGTIQLEGSDYQEVLSAEKRGNQNVHSLLDSYRVWCKCPNNFVVTLDECDLSFSGCFQNLSIAEYPWSPENTSSNLYDVQPVVMAAASLLPDSGFPKIDEMLILENFSLAVDDFSLTVPSYSSYGIPNPGGNWASIATKWLPPSSQSDYGLDVFKRAFVSSLVGHRESLHGSRQIFQV
jgi:inosine-uridine nucleoside N-ribohydrolase